MATKNPNPFSISEEEFELVEEVQATMSPNHDRIVIRKADRIDTTYLNLAVDDLRQRTSTKNQAGVTCNWVLDPQIGCKGPGVEGRTLKGVWRGVSCRGQMRNGIGTVIQTLAYGLIRGPNDTWPAAELVGTSERLIRPHAKAYTPNMEQYELRYRGFDPSYVEAARASITVLRLPAFAAYSIIEAKGVRMQDGSYNIHVLYERVAFAAFSAASPDTTGKRNQGTKFEELDEEWNSIQNDDPLSAVFTYAPAGYRVTDVSIKDQLDGSLKINRTCVLSNAFDAANPHEVWYENKDRTMEVMHEEWYNIAGTDALTGLYTPKAGYTVGYAQKTPNENGTTKIHRVSPKLNDWYTTYILAAGNDRIADCAYWFKRSGVRLGFNKTYWTADHIPVGTADALVKALEDGVNIAEWASGQNYLLYDLRSMGGRTFICSNPHTSAVWTTDNESNPWFRILDVYTRPQDNGVVQVVIESEGVKEAWDLIGLGSESGEQRPFQVFQWKGVDPTRFDTVWTLAQAYKGGTMIGGAFAAEAGSGWEHKSCRKSFDEYGIATITAEAWIPKDSGMSHIMSWNPSLGKTIKQIISLRVEYYSVPCYVVRSITFDVRYYYYEHQAYDFIDKGLEGSRVENTSNYHVWRAIRVYLIQDSNIKYPPVLETAE